MIIGIYNVDLHHSFIPEMQFCAEYRDFFFKAVLGREAKDISVAAIFGTTITVEEITKDMAFPLSMQQPTSPRGFPSINTCPWKCGYRDIKCNSYDIKK